MPEYHISKTDKDYNTLEDYNRVLEGPNRRWIMKHLANENKVVITDSQASLSVLKLNDETMLFITQIK